MPTEPASPPPLPVRRWLGRLARSGGRLQQVALALPLLGGLLLLVQAGLLAHVLHLSIVAHRPAAALLTDIALLAAIWGVRIGLGLLAELAASAAGETIKLRLRQALFADMLAQPPVWTAARSSGRLAAVLIEHIEAMDGYLTRYLPAMAQAAILPLAFAVVLLPVDWMVALLLLVSAPLIPVFMALAGWGAEAASRRQADALGRLSGHFADRLRGITTLKLFGREAAEIAGVGRASEALRARTMQVMRIAFLSSAVLEFFAALGVAGVALYVGLTFLDLVTLRGTELTLEAGLFCLLMAPEVFQPLRLLAAHYHDQAAAKAAAAEIAATMGGLPQTPTEALPAVAAASGARAVAPAVTLAGVRVATPDGRDVIRGAGLDIAAGAHVALLGPSGSGKSTLLEAIAGLRDHAGTIRVGGDGGAVAGSIGMLGQRPTLFAGSIADNIRLGRPDACPTAVRQAAQRADVLAFATTLPEGLDTQLGEGGLGLSGGEVQRIALARLYLLDPALLLLDEPTAHLDAATEARVLDGLLGFARGRTLIVATHSEAVAARMDQCHRLIDGVLLPTPRPRLQTTFERGAA